MPLGGAPGSTGVISGALTSGWMLGLLGVAAVWLLRLYHLCSQTNVELHQHIASLRHHAEAPHTSRPERHHANHSTAADLLVAKEKTQGSSPINGTVTNSPSSTAPEISDVLQPNSTTTPPNPGQPNTTDWLGATRPCQTASSRLWGTDDDDTLARTPTRGAHSPPSLRMAPTLYDARSTLLHWLRPKPAKRVAVAFSGMFRNNEPGNTRNTMRRTMDSYRKHLELANPDFEVDFFFHVYIHTASADLDVRSIEYIRTFSNVRALVVEMFTQELIDSFVETFNSTPFVNFLPGFKRHRDCPANPPSLVPSGKLPHNCGGGTGTGFLSSLRKMYLANALVQDYAAQNQIEYAYVIRARLDRFLGADLVLSRLPPNKITTPKLNEPGVWYTWPNWMEDQFAVAPPALMDRYTSLFTQVGPMFAKSNALFRNKDAWKRSGCTNTSSPYFCQEWLGPRLFSTEEVHPITYPIRCWESAHTYSANEMAEWSKPMGAVHACSHSTSKGHKTVKPDAPAVAWDERSCTFSRDTHVVQ